MKITLELDDRDVREICRITGQRDVHQAVRDFIVETLQLKRREVIANRFLTGEWGAELEGFEEARELERRLLHERINP